MCLPEATSCCQCEQDFDDSGEQRRPCCCPVFREYFDNQDVEAHYAFNIDSDLQQQASLPATLAVALPLADWVPNGGPATNDDENLLPSPLAPNNGVFNFSTTHLRDPTSNVSQQDLAGSYATHVPAPNSQALLGDLTGFGSQYFSNSQQPQDIASWSSNCPPAPGLAAQHMQYGQYQAILQQPHPSLDPHGTESNTSSGSQHNSGISSPYAGIGSADVQYGQASPAASAPRPRSMNSRRNGKRIPLVPGFGSTNGVARTPRRPSRLAMPAQPRAPPSLPIRKHTREQRREFHICHNCYDLVKDGMEFRRDAADMDIRLDSQQCPLCISRRISTSDSRRAPASTIQQSVLIPPPALPEPAQPLQASSLSSTLTAATSLDSPDSSGTSASSMSCLPVFYCRHPTCNRAQGADTGDWPFARKDNCTKHEEMHGYSRLERKSAPRKPKVAMNANYVMPQLLSQAQSQANSSQAQSPLADRLVRMDYS